jgi:hypothetical protein
MSSDIENFVPHVLEEEVSGGGSFRPMLGASAVAAKVGVLMIGKNAIAKKTTGVFLPSFDWGNISLRDSTFGTSVGPHMSQRVDKKAPKHFQPSPWAVPYYCYKFLKPRMDHMLSPASLAMMLGKDSLRPGDTDDPFNELFWFIKKHSDFSEADKDYYLKKPSPQQDAKVPNRSMAFFAQALVRDRDNKNEDRHVVTCYTNAAQDYLIDQMRWGTPYGGTPYDPHWPQYLIGDPTRPDRALVWGVDKRLVGGLREETNVIVFTEQPEVFDPVTAETRVISQEQLAARLNLYDPACWNIPTYQEMVDYLIDFFSDIPVELIKQCCGNKAHIKERSASSSEHAKETGKPAPSDSPVGSVAFDSPAGYGPPSEPTPPPSQSVPTPPPAAPVAAPADAPPPPPSVEAPAPPPPAKVEKFWVAEPGGQPSSMTRPEVQALVDSGSSLQINHAGAWMTFEAAGWKRTAAPAPAVALVDSPPPAPSSAAGGNAEVTDADLMQYVPTYHSLVPADQERARSLVGRLKALQQAGEVVPSDVALAIAQLGMP